MVLKKPWKILKLMISGLTINKKGVYFGGLQLNDFVGKHPTPFFIFSEQRIIDNFKSLDRSFKKYYPQTKIYYSLKTNFEPQILKTLRSLGSLGEAASGLEVKIAQKAGFNTKSLILDGPVWSERDIKYCLEKEIETFNVDSLEMLEKVNQIAKKLKTTARISFRIYPKVKMSILKSFIGEFIAKFGIPISKAVDAYRQSLKFSNIAPVAISTHIGSMITDPIFYEETVDRLVDLAADLKRELNIEIKEINIGGGFGIQSLNYFTIKNVILEKAGISRYERAASIEEFGKRIAGRFKSKLAEKNLKDIKLILEPGRFLVSDAGILVTKVVSVKDKWIFLDGGINLIPESIFFIRRGFLVLNKVGQAATIKFNIAGPTLNTQDVLSENQILPKMEVGDVVLVLDAGAYSLSRSNQFTTLRPEALYLTSEKKIKILRKREVEEEFIKNLLV